jgi:hypothetical protein
VVFSTAWVLQDAIAGAPELETVRAALAMIAIFAIILAYIAIARAIKNRFKDNDRK